MQHLAADLVSNIRLRMPAVGEHRMFVKSTWAPFSQIFGSGGPFWACKNGAGHFWPGKIGAGQKKIKKSETFFLKTSQVRCADMPAARHFFFLIFVFLQKQPNLDPK